MKYTTIMFLLVTALSSVAQGLIQHPSAREQISLNGRWNYLMDPYENGFYNYRREAFDQTASGKGGYYDNLAQDDPFALIEYDFSHAETLHVPGDWNSQKDELKFYEGSIWYHKSFYLEPEQAASYILYFGAVNYEAHVYLNGKKLGVHKGGFTPFQFDITDGLKGGENFVVLKVDNTRKQDEVPTINTDWWNYGGITRDVAILKVPQNYIHDYEVKLNPANKREIRGYVQLAGDELGGKVTVEIPELNISQQVKADDTGKAFFSVESRKIAYWSPENPKLYNVSIFTTEDRVADKIGFRTITTSGKDILLNGKEVFFRGISLHDENPLIPGRLRSEGDIRMVLEWAKELNCNFVRLAHYPHNEKTVRMAEELGLMVWAEVPVYWTISWENEETYRNAESQLNDLIVRDKNRAGVVVWSVGNETPVNEPRLKFMSSLVDKVRAMDDTRLVAAALEIHRNNGVATCDDPLAAKIDLMSFNQYGAWYWGGKPSEIEDYEFRFSQEKPVFISEFGGGALPGFYSKDRVRWSEEYQEDLYVSNLKMLEKIDGLRGMTPWILVDFRSPRRPHPIFQNFWNRKGLISDTGAKKKAFHVLKKYYDEKEKEYSATK